MTGECAALLSGALREFFSFELSTVKNFSVNFFHSAKHHRVRCGMYKFNLKRESAN